MKAMPIQVDTTAYNCVLDVCIKCGDKKSAADLFTKMKVTGYVDTISYNTLLKGMGAGATAGIGGATTDAGGPCCTGGTRGGP